MAPSPSRAICLLRSTHTDSSAVSNASRPAPASSGPPPAAPLAKMASMSLVLVSPSTVTMLKVRSTQRDSTRWSSAAATGASVVRNPSMVAMLIWIIPEPLAIPPMV